jgi:UPF0716 family protein affecting phage T7 exclusion
MSLVKWGFLTVLLLPVLELLLLLLVAAWLGWLLALVLFLATSVLGVLLLQRSGRADLDRLRQAFAHGGWRALHLETPGLANVLGAILLVFPGFITDLLGAALFLPQFRRWAAAALGRARRQHPAGRQVIDLEPGEWRELPDRKPRRRRKSNGGA